jgi:hypothetical protein
MKDLGYNQLGFINLAILYFSYALTSTFGALILQKLGARLALFLSGIGYTTWIASFLMPVY